MSFNVLAQNDEQQRVLYCNGKLFLSTHFMVFLIMHDLFQKVLHSPFNCGWVMETSSKRLSLQNPIMYIDTFLMCNFKGTNNICIPLTLKTHMMVTITMCIIISMQWLKLIDRGAQANKWS